MKAVCLMVCTSRKKQNLQRGMEDVNIRQEEREFLRRLHGWKWSKQQFFVLYVNTEIDTNLNVS